MSNKYETQINSFLIYNYYYIIIFEFIYLVIQNLSTSL